MEDFAMTIFHSTRVAIAEHQAKTALRAGRNGDDAGYVRAQNAMLDMVKEAEYPRLAVRDLIRAIGRSKAMVLRIDRTLINLALDDARFDRCAALGQRKVDGEIVVLSRLGHVMTTGQVVAMALAA